MSKNDHADGDRLNRLFARARWRAGLPYLAVGVVVLLLAVLLGREVDHHLQAIETWIAALGPWGVVAFIGLFVLGTSVLLPETVLCIIAGALFGLRLGVTAVVIGSLCAGAFQYGISRGLLRDRIQKALSARPSLVAIQHAVMGDQFRLQVLLRFTPLNPATISYLLGAAGVRFVGFLVACLALAPSLILEVYLGYIGRHAARISGGVATPERLHEVVILGGLPVGILALVFGARAARKAVMRAVAETGLSETGQSLP